MVTAVTAAWLIFAGTADADDQRLRLASPLTYELLFQDEEGTWHIWTTQQGIIYDEKGTKRGYSHPVYIGYSRPLLSELQEGDRKRKRKAAIDTEWERVFGPSKISSRAKNIQEMLGKR